jgi:hypothetical protein
MPTPQQLFADLMHSHKKLIRYRTTRFSYLSQRHAITEHDEHDFLQESFMHLWELFNRRSTENMTDKDALMLFSTIMTRCSQKLMRTTADAITRKHAFDVYNEIDEVLPEAVMCDSDKDEIMFRHCGYDFIEYLKERNHPKRLINVIRIMVEPDDKMKSICADNCNGVRSDTFYKNLSDYFGVNKKTISVYIRRLKELAVEWKQNSLDLATN